MEEQNQNSVLPEDIVGSKKNWLPIIIGVVFALLIIGGGIYWWLQNNVNVVPEENVITNEVSTNIIDGDDVSGKELPNDDNSDLSLASRCSRANGIWENGKCRAQDCFDMDARIGEDSKYISGSIYYNGDKDIFSDDKENTNESSYNLGYEYSRKNDVCNDSVIKEAVCPNEINKKEDFLNSYIEYQCEEGCDGKIERCKKKDYDTGGIKMASLTLMSYGGSDFIGGRYEANLMPNGTLGYAWGEYSPGAAVLSEQEYLEVYKNISSVGHLLNDVDEENDPYDIKDSEYFDSEDTSVDSYVLFYSYYPEGVEENFYNRKYKNFSCNINCPIEILSLYNDVKKITPKITASDKHWVPQFIYPTDYNDECDRDLACWYRYMASERPDAILGDYDRDNIFFIDIDLKTDTDSDGIPDFNEKYLGTDIYSADTDSDGYEDLQELEGGYSPVGDGLVEYNMEELGNILETQCSEIGGNVGGVDDGNANCWGIDSESDCSLAINCLWTDYNYCKPEAYYCMCDDGKKVHPTMWHLFEGSCDLPDDGDDIGVDLAFLIFLDDSGEQVEVDISSDRIQYRVGDVGKYQQTTISKEQFDKLSETVKKNKPWTFDTKYGDSSYFDEWGKASLDGMSREDILELGVYTLQINFSQGSKDSFSGISDDLEQQDTIEDDVVGIVCVGSCPDEVLEIIEEIKIITYSAF
jgi:hypothetical protein